MVGSSMATVAATGSLRSDVTRKFPPGRASTRIPVEERYGLIFAFLGDLPEEERPLILEITEHGEDGPMEGWAAGLFSTSIGISTINVPWRTASIRHTTNIVHPTHGFSGEREDYHV